MMIEVVSEFMIRDGMGAQFELMFGPGGACSDLFARLSGFRGLSLMRDVENSQRYLAVEIWESEARRAEAVEGHQKGYSELDDALGRLASARVDVGRFRLLAEASVRPRPRAKHT